MARIGFLYIYILIGIFSCSQHSDEKAEDIILEIKNEYAPDQRTSIFNIEAKGNPITLKGETNLIEAKHLLLQTFQKEGIEIKDEIVILPDETIGVKKYGLINVSVANLRGQPSHSAELVTQALLGTTVNILKEEDGWYLIQTPDKYIAWTNGGALELLDGHQLQSWKDHQKVIYTNTYGFSFSPNGSERVTDLVAGNVLELDHESDNSWIVIYPDGRKAMIPKSEASLFQRWKENIEVSDATITSAAKDLVGIPYLWGGTSTKGLDCSGFTKTVYLLHGFVLPRDASQQVQVGDLIDTVKDFSKLEIGDLLFFGRKNEDQSEKVVHVGLWLGNSRFIHASGDVHISSMDSLDDEFDNYNFERYLRTKRIIGADTSLEKILAEIYQ